MPLEQFVKIAINKIVTAKQVREYFDQESIAGLAETMKSQGQLQPIRVRKVGDKYVIVDGARRFEAAKIAGLAELDAIVEERDLTPAEITERSLIANCQREDLTPTEKAFGIKALMDATGENCSEVALRLGMTGSTVSRLLTIVALPKAILDQISAGKIPASAAPELAKIQDPSKQQEIADQLASGKLTRDGVANATKRKKRASSRPAKTPSGRLIAMLGLGRVVSVIAPALSLEAVIELLEELLAKARKAKGQNLSLATFGKLLEDQCRA